MPLNRAQRRRRDREGTPAPRVSAETIVTRPAPQPDLAPAPSALAPTPRPASPLIVSPGLKLEPTTNPWLNASLPRVLPAGWSELPQFRDGQGVVYASTMGMRVRVSAAVRHDGRRWLYLLISATGRVPSLVECEDVRRLFVGPATETVIRMPGPWMGSLPAGLVLLMTCGDGPTVPAGAGPGAEFP